MSEDNPQQRSANLSPQVVVDSIRNHTSDAIVALDFDRKILSWNRGAERIFGYAAEEMVGKRADAILPEGAELEIDQVFSQMEAGERSITFDATRRTKLGATIEVEISLSTLSGEEGVPCGIFAIARDVSRQRSTERALAQRLRQQSGISWLGERAIAGVGVETLLNDSVQLVQQTLEVDLVKILECVPGKDKMLLSAGVGWGEGLVGTASVSAGLNSQAGFTLVSHEPVLVDDLKAETRFTPAPLLLEHDVVSGISTFIEGEDAGEQYGVIGAHTRAKRTFTQDDVNFLKTVATLLASAIRQARAAADRRARERAEQNLRATESAARQRQLLLDAANQVALNILSSRTGNEALRHIAEAARVLAGAQYAALGVANLEGAGLEEFVTVGMTDEEKDLVRGLPHGKGILGLLLEQEKPLRIDDLAAHPSSVGFPPNHPSMKSFLGVPIRSEDTTVGSLYLTNKLEGGTFSQQDEIAVQALGAYAAVAIHNLRMIFHQKGLTRSLLKAQEEERRSLAHDLHDGLTQYVMAAHAHLEASRLARSAGKSERADAQLEKTSEYLGEAVVESRRMINNLRLLVLDDLGVVGALQQLLREEAARAGWEDFRLIENLSKERFEPALETALYRDAQEALTNARKHASTSQLTVKLEKRLAGRTPNLVLTVEDRGRGFDVGSAVAAPSHFGLRGLQERVQTLSGRVEIRSSPASGTVVQASFPL